MKTIEKLVKFVNQRPGLEYCNYGDPKSYRAEMREITNDRADFNELLGFALRRVDNLESKLTQELTGSNGRLTLKGETLEYITGQYFPTEYRPAAARVLANLIWADYRNEKREDGTPVYPDGEKMRKAIMRNLSRRVCRNYFN